MFLKLWRLVLELKLNPKKLEEDKRKPQKKIINHFEPVRGRSSEKKDNEDDQKKPK